MEPLLTKFSQYNIFNYLFPGILFSMLLKQITPYSLIIDNILLSIFIYYFAGMIISRFGSIVIEPILIKRKIIKYADYKDYISASKNDEKIELFSEINNTYRTLLSAIVLLLVSKLYSFLELTFHLPSLLRWGLLLLSILVLLVFSYAKQTDYIRKRIDAQKS